MSDSWAGALLEVRGVGVSRGRARLLDAVDLVVEPRSWTAVVGPNGAGKSTLVRALAGLVRHDGTVLLDGRGVERLPARERAQEIGYAPQVPVLPEAVTVAEYVLLGRTPYRSLLAGPAPRGPRGRRVRPGAARATAFADRALRTLSGGERQRAVLARALAQQPRLLLLDEPTAALDLGHAQGVLELVDELRREHGMTVVTTIHDLVLAAQYADRLVLLAGRPGRAAGAPARRADQRGARHPLRGHRRGERRRGRRPRASGAPLARAAMSDSPRDTSWRRTEAGRGGRCSCGSSGRAGARCRRRCSAGPRPVRVVARRPGRQGVLQPRPGGARPVDRGRAGPAPDAGCAMLTAADVRRWAAATDEGVEVAATVGLGLPVHGRRAGGGARRSRRRAPVGTINVLVVVPAPLSDAALVNAVVTATEAKVQALAEAGVPGTAPPRTPSASRAPSPRAPSSPTAARARRGERGWLARCTPPSRRAPPTGRGGTMNG